MRQASLADWLTRWLEAIDRRRQTEDDNVGDSDIINYICATPIANSTMALGPRTSVDWYLAAEAHALHEHQRLSPP
jgi:hypothetical protein